MRTEPRYSPLGSLSEEGSVIELSSSSEFDRRLRHLAENGDLLSDWLFDEIEPSLFLLLVDYNEISPVTMLDWPDWFFWLTA